MLIPNWLILVFGEPLGTYPLLLQLSRSSAVKRRVRAEPLSQESKASTTIHDSVGEYLASGQ